MHPLRVDVIVGDVALVEQKGPGFYRLTAGVKSIDPDEITD